MFPNFTGNSRRTRNVNLSGQRSNNPFTSNSWASGTPVGASRTVAHAQAERQQRQRERDRVKAALVVQSSWRGYRVRRILGTARRHQFDGLYSGNEVPDTQQRSIRALPLFLSFYRASLPQDQQRLWQVAQDLVTTNFGAFTSGELPGPRLTSLANILVTALEKLDPEDPLTAARTLLEAVNGIIATRPASFESVLPRYYKILARCCQQVDPAWGSLDFMLGIVVAPLATREDRKFTQTAYRAFAFNFLSQRSLRVFEDNIHSFAHKIDKVQLSESIHASISEDTKPSSAYLWLLAHFIALHRAEELKTLRPGHIRTLYLLLCTSANQIRDGFASPAPRSNKGKAADNVQEILPPYVSKMLASIVDKNEISRLLEKFTTTDRGKTVEGEPDDASLLAGYILTLLYCFPSLGDDIRMRLYLADISTRRGPMPAVKFFWSAVTKTTIFPYIATDEDGALDVLRSQPLSTQSVAAVSGSKWHSEWRTTLLFLELYAFVLRLTDDEDFFGGLSDATGVLGAGSRLRSSSLTQDELKSLTSFLKHLAFTLYCHTPESLLGSTSKSGPQGVLDDYLLGPSRKKDAVDSISTPKSQSFIITAGIEFSAFRNLVTGVMKMLYERDSRRPFLPQDHWLMTSKFDMTGFLSAVVLEEQRRQALRISGGEDEEADEDEMDIDDERAWQRRQSPHARLERLRAQQRKAARERLRAANEPKLEILRNMPFVIPFEIRVQVFRQFVHLDMERRRGGNVDPDRWRLWILSQHGSAALDNRGPISKHQAQITRGKCFADAMKAFWELGEGLKEPIQITFVDEFGMQEAGIDGGGVTKEFLTSVTQEAFTKDQRLFATNSRNAYYPNPCAVDQLKDKLRAAHIPEGSAEAQENLLELTREFEFLGRIIGKCMYEGILINIAFAGFFLLKWSLPANDTYRANINDLRELDEELYQGLMSLKNYPGDVEDLGVDFTITDVVSPPEEDKVRTVTRNLIPGGEAITVNNENRPLYISYVARHRLVLQPFVQTRAFLRGLSTIIEPGWLHMFNQNELQRLVGGDSSEIDVEDLRRNTIYSGVYSLGTANQEHPTVKLFWEVMHSLRDEERREVLKYVTSTPRAPLLGFSQLKPAFSIRDGGLDQERLPSASTCINLLKLPQYTSAATLKSKLLYAVKSGAGFDLS